MIVRIWRGWTTQADAAAYQHLLETAVIPGILARNVRGFRDIDVLRGASEHGEEVEFVTIMRFDDWDAVSAFAGDSREAAVVPAAARALLARYDDRSRHYEHVARRSATS